MPRRYRLHAYLLSLVAVLALTGTALAQGVQPPPPPVPPPLGPVPVPTGIIRQPQHSDPFWVATYWSNVSLTGTPVLQRTEAAIDYDWGDGAPAPNVPADNFSVRWSRYVQVPAGTYRFTATTDDGVRVWVDNALIIDHWDVHAAQSYSADVSLSADHHLVVVEYFEAAGKAVARVSYAPTSVAISNWRGEYFNNMTLSGDPALVRDDAQINFNWGNGSPAPGVVNGDGFSARWTRYLDLPAGQYRFSLTVDDGARLWVNGHLLVDTWQVQAAHTYTGDIFLPGGSVLVRLEYFENNGLAQAQLSWGGNTGNQPPPVGGPGEVVVDDSGPGFVRGGSATGWRTAAEGYSGQLTWSRNNDVTRANYNWGRWYPSLAPGRYEVYVYIPAHYAGTTSARYWIANANGFSQRVVNQAGYANQWVSLGIYNFTGTNSDYVSLSDITGEAYLSHTIAWDAAKFVPR